MRKFSKIKVIIIVCFLLGAVFAISWRPLFATVIHWYLTQKIEKEFGDSFYVEKVTWEKGLLRFNHPTIKERLLSAKSIDISYEYSLWNRAIDFKIRLIDPVLSLNASAGLLLQPFFVNLNNDALPFSLRWTLSTQNGFLQKKSGKLIPLSLELASHYQLEGKFSLEFSPISILNGQIESDKTLSFDLTKIPLEDIHLISASEYEVKHVKGKVNFQQENSFHLDMTGHIVHDKQSLKTSLSGYIQPIFSHAFSPTNVAFNNLQMVLQDDQNQEFKTILSGKENKELLFSGNTGVIVKLLPKAIKNSLQKQLNLNQIALEGSFKQNDSKCILESTLIFHDVLAPKQEDFTLVFDVKNIRKFLSNTTFPLPFESYCCDLYLAGNLSINQKSTHDFLGITITAETLSGQLSDIKHLFSHFKPLASLASIPLQGNLSLGKGKNYVDLKFTSEGCKFTPCFAGSLTGGHLSHPSRDLALDDLNFDFTYHSESKTLEFDNLQGVFLLGDAENPDEYSLAGHSMNVTDLYKLQGNFDIALNGSEGTSFRLAGQTQLKDENDFLSVQFDHHRSHINDMPIAKAEMVLDKTFKLKHLQFEFPLPLNRFVSIGKSMSKTALGHNMGLSPVKWNTLKNSEGTLQAEIKYDQPNDAFLFTMQGSDLSFGTRHIDKFMLNGKKRGDIWSIENLQIDDLSIAADIMRENHNWILNFFGLRWGSSLLLGLKGEYSTPEKTFRGNIDLLELNLNTLKEIKSLQTWTNHYNPKGNLKASGKLLISPKSRIDITLNASLTEPQFMNVAFGDIQDATIKVRTRENVNILLDIPQNGVSLDLTKDSMQNRSLFASMAIDLGKAKSLLPKTWQETLSTNEAYDNVQIKGQGRINAIDDKSKGHYSFEGRLTADNLQIKKNQIFIPQLNLYRLEGVLGQTKSLSGSGDFNFSVQSNRTRNPLVAIPMDIINKIGLDRSIMTPASGTVFFDLRDEKIVLKKLHDVYSEGKTSKFYLADGISSIDFNGNLNLQIRMKHYSLLLKLSELLTFNVTGTLEKPIYQIKKQPRKR